MVIDEGIDGVDCIAIALRAEAGQDLTAIAVSRPES